MDVIFDLESLLSSFPAGIYLLKVYNGNCAVFIANFGQISYVALVHCCFLKSKCPLRLYTWMWIQEKMASSFFQSVQ